MYRLPRCEIRIGFAEERATFHPGALVRGAISIEGPELRKCERISLQWEWQGIPVKECATELLGGELEPGVALHRRFDLGAPAWRPSRVDQRIDGRFRLCAQAYFAGGETAVAEAPIRLALRPAAGTAASAPSAPSATSEAPSEALDNDAPRSLGERAAGAEQGKAATLLVVLAHPLYAIFSRKAAPQVRTRAPSTRRPGDRER